MCKPCSLCARDCFATAQNKLLDAVTGQTAAELISECVDSSKNNLDR